MQNIIQKIIDMFDFTKIYLPIKNIMKIGIRISFIILLYAVLILSLYLEFQYSSTLYFIGSELFKSASTFIVYFLICGISFNKIHNEIKS